MNLFFYFCNKSNNHFNKVPEHQERETHEQPEGSPELRHERGQRVDEDFLPLDQRGLREPQVQHGLLGCAADDLLGQGELRVAAGGKAGGEVHHKVQVGKSEEIQLTFSCESNSRKSRPWSSSQSIGHTFTSK